MKALGIIERSEGYGFDEKPFLKYYIIVEYIPSRSGFMEYYGRRLQNVSERVVMGSLKSLDVCSENIRWLTIEECLTHHLKEVRLAAIRFLIQMKDVPDEKYSKFIRRP